MWPIEKYISTTRKPSDQKSRRFSFGVSWSSSCASASDGFMAALPPLMEAPYPASCTAAMTASSAAVPSTPIELVNRLTEPAVTPGTLETAFSTRALHAAQLMPVTLNCFIFFTLPVAQYR